MVETRGSLCSQRYGWFLFIKYFPLGLTRSFCVLGSCSLEYRLVQIPDSLRTSDSPIFRSKGKSSFKKSALENLRLFSSDYDWAGIAFWIVWLGFIALILYSVLLSCRNRNSRTAPGPSSNDSPRRPNSGSGNWFPGDHHDNHYPSDPPPPYPKYQQQDAPPAWQNWRPGFWTGAALGGLANHWWNGPRTEVPVRRTAYDWERPSFFGRGSGYSTTRQQPTTRHDYDRGEGSSNLGPMRRSTGLGGSSVR
jgi:hypothetical protein